jgi:hypothetical protein
MHYEVSSHSRVTNITASQDSHLTHTTRHQQRSKAGSLADIDSAHDDKLARARIANIRCTKYHAVNTSGSPKTDLAVSLPSYHWTLH